MNGTFGRVLRAIEHGPKTGRQVVAYTGLSLNSVGCAIGHLLLISKIVKHGDLGVGPRSSRIIYGIPGRDAPFVREVEEAEPAPPVKRSKSGSGQIAGHVYCRQYKWFGGI